MGYDLVGQRVRLIFEDLGQSNSKIGVIISENNNFVEIKTDNKTEYIPIVKIIRMEIL
ncbi:unnamed protein product, partial [marine sediment metagenome]